jgi:hypothetical protein
MPVKLARPRTGRYSSALGASSRGISYVMSRMKITILPAMEYVRLARMEAH